MNEIVEKSADRHMLNIVILAADEKPFPATAHLTDRPVKSIDIFTAAKEDLEQARTDLNNRTIRQDFDDNLDERSIRSELHALLLNQLQKVKL